MRASFQWYILACHRNLSDVKMALKALLRNWLGLDFRHSEFNIRRVAALLVITGIGITGIWLTDKYHHEKYVHVFSAFLAVGLYDLLRLALEAHAERSEKVKFNKLLFGKYLPTRVQLVFPDFELNPLHLTQDGASLVKSSLPFPVSKGNDLLYLRPADLRRERSVPLPSIGLNRVAALDDLKALGHVASWIGSMGNLWSPEISTDSDLKNRQLLNNNIISFGLFSNYVTHIARERGLKDFINFTPDNTNTGSIELLHEEWDCPGPEASENRVYKDDDVYDFGMIAKIHPTGFDGKTWIIVAGIGLAGTFGAGRFLATRWREIYDLKAADGARVGDREFCAIIRVPQNPDLHMVLDRVIIRNVNPKKSFLKKSAKQNV
jgi:hypothetical protein